VVLQEGLMRAEVLELGWREARGGGGVEEVVEGVGVELVEGNGAAVRSCGNRRRGSESMDDRTFASLALKNERTRNLKRSSSVCMIMRRKLAFGSVLPVCSSTSSILLARAGASVFA